MKVEHTSCIKNNEIRIIKQVEIRQESLHGVRYLVKLDSDSKVLLLGAHRKLF